ncbi:unnamed protein product [Oppiella nova]|uniref:Uncharacterized protein n=1 Tax=Oppiella nova TaxID=334625 RepID=A0A7R9QJT0_9ACAR|nr:unnamed protein product [Oppiella nova]CAG2167243.1 unnamed protein product [Oppiella nova]
MSFTSKSLKSNSSQGNLSRGNASSVQLNQQIQELSQTITKQIAEDLPLLKPHVDWRGMAHPMPVINNKHNNQTISESQLMSEINEMNARLDPPVNGIKHDVNQDNDKHLDLLSDSTNRLKTTLPTFRQLVHTFGNKYQKQSIDENNGFDPKCVDISAEKVDKILRMSQQIHHFQQSDKILNTLSIHELNS